MLAPIFSSTGRARSRSFASPPTMKVSVPAMAPPVPPETGASIMAMPLAAAASATLREVAAAMVLLSMTSVPAAMLSSRPGLPAPPRNRPSTCALAGSMLITTSASATESAAEEAMPRPSAAYFLQASADRSKALTSWPAFFRFMAMGPPMLPRPMNAIFIFCLRCICGSGSDQRSQLGRHFAARAQVVFDERERDLFDGGRVPARVAVLVDQHRADALGKILVRAKTQRSPVFEPEHLGQRHLVHALPELEAQRSRTLRTLHEGLGCGLQPRIVALQVAQAVRNVEQVVAGHQGVDGVVVLAHLGWRHLRALARPREDSRKLGTVGLLLAVPTR